MSVARLIAVCSECGLTNPSENNFCVECGYCLELEPRKTVFWNFKVVRFDPIQPTRLALSQGIRTSRNGLDKKTNGN